MFGDFFKGAQTIVAIKRRLNASLSEIFLIISIKIIRTKKCALIHCEFLIDINHQIVLTFKRTNIYLFIHHI